MTPADAKAMYRRQIAAHGETITLRRTGQSDQSVRARVTGYEPEELVGGIQQGDRKVIVLAEDVTGFTPRKGDLVILRGAPLSIQAVDDSTRRVAGTLVAYELVARGM